MDLRHSKFEKTTEVLRLAVQKRRFEEDVRGASNFLKKRAPEEMRKHLRMILSKEFGAVENVGEALEIAKLRRKVARADDDGPGAA